jgi:hypothetical protein
MRYWVHADTFDVGDLREKATKPLEEAAEACEAARAWGRATGDAAPLMRLHALTECCDVIQAALNLAAALGATQAELDRAMEDVRRANEERGRYR